MFLRKPAIWAGVPLLLLALSTQAQQGQNRGWTNYAGGPDSSHYVALNQINKSNVKQLEVAWSYASQDNLAYVFNPLVVDNMMYVLARNTSLVAIDATTGKEIWVHEELNGISQRGVAFWESRDHKDRRLIFAMN